MKLKISSSSITYKIDEAELNVLLAGSAVEMNVAVGGDNIGACVCVAANSEELPSFLVKQGIGGDVVLALQVSMQDIAQLAQMGKSKNGLSKKIGDTDVVLQVDVKNDIRARKP